MPPDDDLPPGIVRSKARVVDLPLPNPVRKVADDLPHVAGEGEPDGADLILGRSTEGILALARKFRKSATSGEDLLWQLLRRKQLGGRTFRRQYPLGRFIADFYCDDAGLVVEVDGAYHGAVAQHERETILIANNLSVLRFSNEDILQNTTQVIEHISRFLRTNSHTYAACGTSDPLSASAPPSPTLCERGERVPPPAPRLTAMEPQERRAGRLNLFVDGEFVVGIYDDVALALGLRVGQEITPERLEEIVGAETVRRAKEDAYRLLSYRARSEREITDRLRRRPYDEPVILEVLAHLRAVGFLNDEDFTRRWVEARGNARGRRALAHELRVKGVDPEIADRILNDTRAGDQEVDAARTVAIRRVGDRPADQSREAKAKLATFLARRGFTYDTIRPVLNELFTGVPRDDELPEEFET